MHSFSTSSPLFSVNVSYTKFHPVGSTWLQDDGRMRKNTELTANLGTHPGKETLSCRTEVLTVAAAAEVLTETATVPVVVETEVATTTGAAGEATTGEVGAVAGMAAETLSSEFFFSVPSLYNRRRAICFLLIWFYCLGLRFYLCFSRSPVV